MPDTCKEPVQEGAPFLSHPSSSLGRGAMPVPSPVLPPLGRPPSGSVLDESSARRLGRFLLRRYDTRL